MGDRQTVGARSEVMYFHILVVEWMVFSQSLNLQISSLCNSGKCKMTVYTAGWSSS